MTYAMHNQYPMLHTMKGEFSTGVEFEFTSPIFSVEGKLIGVSVVRVVYYRYLLDWVKGLDGVANVQEWVFDQNGNIQSYNIGSKKMDVKKAYQTAFNRVRKLARQAADWQIAKGLKQVIEGMVQ